MGNENLKQSIITAKERKKLLKQAVPMQPDAPENIRLSKAQFIAKRQKENEEKLAVEQFIKERRAKKEPSNAVEEKVQEKEEAIKDEAKRGRPKKVVVED